MTINISVDTYEYEDDFKQLSVDGTSLSVEIRYDTKAVKLIDATGNYYYFEDMNEVLKLIAMLGALVELNPPIERRGK